MNNPRTNPRANELKRAALRAQAQNEQREKDRLEARIEEELILKRETNQTQKKVLYAAIGALLISLVSLVVSILAFIRGS